jgi:hypothetical protein
MLNQNIRAGSVGVFLLLCVEGVTPATAQQRGQYPSGFFAVNSGVQPEPGLTYENVFYNESATRLKDAQGKGIPVDGQFAIFVDNNVFIYVYKPKILGGNLESAADITIANANLAGDVFTPRIPGVPSVPVNGGGGGLANNFFVPLQIGWHLKRMDIQAGYSFIAPTGRYTFGASNNTGTGYWTNAVQAGATIYLTANKATAINAFNFYAWNTQQPTTHITYGQSDSFDYSVTQVLPLAKDNKYLLQTGFVGYGQWQTSSPGLPSAASALPPGLVVPVLNSRFGVNAIGFTANVLVPGRKIAVGGSAFWELGAYNTREGHVVMISAAFNL